MALDSLLDHAELQARSIIAALPDGEYTFWDHLEGDVVPEGRPLRIRLTLRIRGSDLEIDFTGTDPQVAAAFNVPTYGTDGHYLLVMALVNYMRTVQPDLLYNSGLVRPVRLRVPRGSLRNPEPFAPCGARQATFFGVADVVLGALAQALPHRMPAAGCGQGSIMLVSTADLERGERHVSIVQPLVGGSGARPAQGGTDGVDFTTGFYWNIPTEILEAEVPVRVETYALRPDSGGPRPDPRGDGATLRPARAGPGGGRHRARSGALPVPAVGEGRRAPGGVRPGVLEGPGGCPCPVGKIDVLEVPPGGRSRGGDGGGRRLRASGGEASRARPARRGGRPRLPGAGGGVLRGRRPGRQGGRGGHARTALAAWGARRLPAPFQLRGDPGGLRALLAR